VDFRDLEKSVVAFIRKGNNPKDMILVVCNCTPLARENYIMGVPRGGRWLELLNSDTECYSGAGFGNSGGVEGVPVAAQGKYHSLYLTLPPLGVLYRKPAG
jgi:1,4-alpha-glucan branching enzyme